MYDGGENVLRIVFSYANGGSVVGNTLIGRDALKKARERGTA
jgi:hypothetical protein